MGLRIVNDTLERPLHVARRFRNRDLEEEARKVSLAMKSGNGNVEDGQPSKESLPMPLPASWLSDLDVSILRRFLTPG